MSQAEPLKPAAESPEVLELRASNAKLESMLSKALGRLDAIESQATPTSIAATPGMEKSPYQRQIEKASRRREETQRHRDRIEADLLDGSKKFSVGIAGESRMTRTVGANSVHEAEAKWRSYFGVIGTNKVIDVAEVAEESGSLAR